MTSMLRGVPNPDKGLSLGHNHLSDPVLKPPLKWPCVCHREFNKLKRCLIPFAVVFAFCYNIPRYFELTWDFDEATNTTGIKGTPLRLHPIYINVYILW